MKTKTRKIPMRRCVGCMESKPKKELVRIRVSEEGQIEIDPTGKAKGRGLYLCPNTDCFLSASKKRAISRGLNIETDEGQIERLGKELASYAAKSDRLSGTCKK